MEIIPSGIISSISNSLCAYCVHHLKHHQRYSNTYVITCIVTMAACIIRYCEQHLLLVWAVTMVMIECHASEIHQENFITSIVTVTV